jgi:hypothetical protein
MPRQQPRIPFAADPHAWVAMILLSAALGCGQESADTRAADVRPDEVAKAEVDTGLADASPPARDVGQLSVPVPSPSEPVTAAMTIQPASALAGKTVELVVSIRIASGHYVHGAGDEDSPFVPLAMQITLPEGIEAVGDWKLPAPEKGRGNSFVYRDAALLRRPLKVLSNCLPQILALTGELSYQVCNDELCWPTGTMELSTSLVIQP